MSYKPKPWKTRDNQALNRAQRANRKARHHLERILEEEPSGGRLWQMLARVAHALGENLDALAEMERIRRDAGEIEEGE